MITFAIGFVISWLISRIYYRRKFTPRYDATTGTVTLPIRPPFPIGSGSFVVCGKDGKP